MFGGTRARRGCGGRGGVATVWPVIAASRRNDTSQPFGVWHGLKLRLEIARSYIRRPDDESNTRWCRVGGATIRSSRADEGGVSNERVSLNCEVVSRRDGNAVSKGARKPVVQDGTRGADIGAKLVDEPRRRPNGDTDSVQRVRRDDAFIERRQT
jgi:hypothetical protein